MALVEVSLSVTCRTQSATCAVTEVNESQKRCENTALNLEDCCCAVNLRACTSAQNYLRADVSMETAHCVLRGLISSHSSDWGDKSADCRSVCGELSDARWPSSVPRRDKRSVWLCWALVVVVVGVHVFCRSGTTMSEGWLPVMAAGWASWQKVLGSHPWISTKEPAAPPALTVRSSASLPLSGCTLHWTGLLSSVSLSNLSSLRFKAFWPFQHSEENRIWYSDISQKHKASAYLSIMEVLGIKCGKQIRQHKSNFKDYFYMYSKQQCTAPPAHTSCTEIHFWSSLEWWIKYLVLVLY